MDLPTRASPPTVRLLPDVLSALYAGYLAIPRFQRPYVWTDAQRLQLLRSIRNGLPIGAFLVWRTNQEIPTFAHFHHHHFRTPSSGHLRDYLIDGQQRLLTLLGALVNPPPTDDGAVDQPETTSTKWWDFAYDLDKQDFVLLGGTPPLHHQLPLTHLLDGVALATFRRSLREHAPADKQQAWREEVNQLSVVFSTYPIVHLIVQHNSFESARDAFLSVNSFSTPVSASDLLYATVWRPDFDLRRQVRALRRSVLPQPWKHLPDSTLIQAWLTALGWFQFREIPDLPQLHTLVDKHPDAMHSAGAAIRQTVDYFAEHFGVLGARSLPDLVQFEIVLFMLQVYGVERLRARQIVVELWFWWTSFSHVLTTRHQDAVFDAFGRLLGPIDWRPEAPVEKALSMLRTEIEDLEMPIQDGGRWEFGTSWSRTTLLRWALSDPPELVPGQRGESSWKVLIAGDPSENFLRLFPHAALGQGLACAQIGNRIPCAPEAKPVLQALFRSPAALRAIDPEVLAAHCISPEFIDHLEGGYPLGAIKDRTDAFQDFFDSEALKLGLHEMYSDSQDDYEGEE